MAGLKVSHFQSILFLPDSLFTVKLVIRFEWTFDVNLMKRVVDCPDDPQDDLHTLVQFKFPASPAIWAAQVNSNVVDTSH